MMKNFHKLALATALTIVGTLISPLVAQAGELGGVDLDAYCKVIGFQSAKLVDNTDAGWRCYSFHIVPDWGSIDMNDACKLQYGPDVYAKSNPPHDQNSWVCVEN